MSDTFTLPIDDVLNEISEKLSAHNRLVLSAPPGAGKTTRVPLHLLNEGWLGDGKIIMLEPRRIAARMAAERMARSLGEKLGETIGLRTRLETRVSSKTRIEVVTEGVFTNLITRDPDLPGIGAVIFDEFHERSLDADLGLALSLETQNVLNEDLRVIVMSATLNVDQVANYLKAPCVESEGRSFPIETIYLGRSQDRIEDQVANAIRRALREQEGSVLAFLPGAAEIRRTAERLNDLPHDTALRPLYGALSPKEQDEAITPCKDGNRKVVLATDIAESSLTIEGARVVVDAGLARIPDFAPDATGPNLRTVRASIANIDQRRGRSGRTEPGVCYRLWHEEENRGLAKAQSAEVLSTDLSSMILRLGAWGNADPFELNWLDPPPKGRVEAALGSLKKLKLLDDDNALTPIGQKATKLPMHPRLAALILKAETNADRVLAAQITALLSEQGLGGRSLDLSTRLKKFQSDSSGRAKALMRRATDWAGTTEKPSNNVEKVLAKGWPDRIARKRSEGRYQLASGGGVRLAENTGMEKADWLVVAETGGQSGGDAIIRSAVSISEKLVLEVIGAKDTEFAEFDPASQKVKSRRQKRVGEIVVSETPLPKPSGAAAKNAVLRYINENGFTGLESYAAFSDYLSRAGFLRQYTNADLPDALEEGLVSRLEDWFEPVLEAEGLDALKPRHLVQAVKNDLGWDQARQIDELVPEVWSSPTGRNIKIDYSGELSPLISIRVQDLYGLKVHPSICEGRAPLTISLLSPAQRQVALTKDLPGFWGGGYADMRKDMKGRYPKHFWPEDPANAEPPKPRGRK